VACSVVGALAASSTTVLVMPRAERSPTTGSVELPSFDPGAPDPAGDGPAVTGAQIADLAATPALRRAEELAAALAPRPTSRPSARPSARPRAEEDDDGDRDRIRKACREGRMKGRVCRGR
jgi:hypothetical protein